MCWSVENDAKKTSIFNEKEPFPGKKPGEPRYGEALPEGNQVQKTKPKSKEKREVLDSSDRVLERGEGEKLVENVTRLKITKATFM